jgi:hypothetical protein
MQLIHKDFHVIVKMINIIENRREEQRVLKFLVWRHATAACVRKHRFRANQMADRHVQNRTASIEVAVIKIAGSPVAKT